MHADGCDSAEFTLKQGIRLREFALMWLASDQTIADSRRASYISACC